MIPGKLYKKIVELVPLVCVDVVLVYRGKFLLVKRATEPLKNHWWVVGGRAIKGEFTLDTARRKVLEEIGIKITHLNILGLYEDHYKKSAWGVPTSSVSVVYEAQLKNLDIKTDMTIDGWKLSEFLPSRFLKNLICLK